ncbi:MAG: hypothetical protein ACM34H_01145 [Deltaproteobacteria bacterium]
MEDLYQFRGTSARIKEENAGLHPDEHNGYFHCQARQARIIIYIKEEDRRQNSDYGRTQENKIPGAFYRLGFLLWGAEKNRNVKHFRAIYPGQCV